MKAAPFLFLVASACCLAQSKPDATGTYELMVCKNTCSFQSPQTAIARGVVVLFDSALARTDVKKLDPFHFGVPNEVVRACFAGAESRDAESFAFGQETGVTSWSQEGKTLTFSLMRSIDAGYDVELVRDGDLLSGKGLSWGAGAAAPGYTPDVIVGRRVGAADISACSKPTTPPGT